MMEAELIRAVLIEGVIGGAMLSLVAWLLSRFAGDIVGRTLLATVLFAAAGAYFGFAVAAPVLVSRLWPFIELLQVIAFGAMGLAGWKGSVKWLALGWALHPIWDFGVHHLGPGRNFAPFHYVVVCITFDWVVAAYILMTYRGASRLTPTPAR